MASRLFARTTGISRQLICAGVRLEREPLINLSDGLHSLSGFATRSSMKWVPRQMNQLSSHSELTDTTLQRFGFSSSASPQPTEETNQYVDGSEVGANTESAKTSGDSSAPEHDTDAECDLSYDDLVKLVAEKEELLQLKYSEIEKMQDKVLRSYAEMENVIDRTKRDAENSKKFAIQNFAKGLLDVADNLGRASSVVKESFSKIDSSKDSVGAVPLLETLLGGVDMTNKQLTEVFRKFGVEKFDPLNEHFDPNRHNAVFQIPDATKPTGTVAAVIKPGYMLYGRIIRPAEVGVTRALDDQSSDA